MDVVEGPPGEMKPARAVSDGKLIVAEDKAQGHMSRQAIQLFVSSLGGIWFWVWPLSCIDFLLTKINVADFWPSRKSRSPSSSVSSSTKLSSSLRHGG
jgi:hypothetical protein